MSSMIQLKKDDFNSIILFLKEYKEAFRAVIILLSNFFKSSEVIRILDLKKSTYYDRISKFNMEKENSFVDKARTGAPKKLDFKTELKLIETVSKFPVKEGSNYTKWTCRTLKLHLKLEVSEELIRLKLRKNNKTWHKPRHKVDSPDPERNLKLLRIATIRANLKKNEVLLNEDEADFNLFCCLRNMWQDKGKQVRIQTPRKNEKVYAFGAKEKATGRVIYRVFERKRSVEFIKFLEHIINAYSGKKIYMIVDNYCVHDCKRTTAFLDKNSEKIELVPLPTYSPDDNALIERVWGTTKEWINSNYLFSDKYELMKYVHKGLRLYQLHSIKEKAA